MPPRPWRARRADGYTLLWGVTPPITINPALSKVSYDPVKDFAPISAVGTNAFVLLVNKSFPPKTVAEFVSYVRSQPNKLSYAEGSAGSLTHLSMALFLKRAGLDMTNVSYRGNAPALTDVVAGHLPVMFSNISDAIPQAASGAVRLLGGVERAARAADSGRADGRGIGLSRLRRHHLERPDGAGRHATRDRAEDRRRDRPRGQGPAVRGAPRAIRRRSARQHASRRSPP